MGNFARYLNILQRVKRSKAIDIVALGGSITAGGYFEEFARMLRERDQLEVKVHNHGHGATELTCKYNVTIFWMLYSSKIVCLFRQHILC